MAGRIAWAKDVGLTQMMVPSLDGPKNPTMDDVKRAADEYNKIARTSRPMRAFSRVFTTRILNFQRWMGNELMTCYLTFSIRSW